MTDGSGVGWRRRRVGVVGGKARSLTLSFPSRVEGRGRGIYQEASAKDRGRLEASHHHGHPAAQHKHGRARGRRSHEVAASPARSG